MRINCRSCHSSNLESIYYLGIHYLPDFIEPGTPRAAPWPLHLVQCQSCTLLQLTHSAPRASLYHERYGFKSGVNEAIKADLEDVVAWALKRRPHENMARRRWLDIACNDGTLLSYVPPSINRTGVDPLKQFAAEAQTHADMIVSDFFSPEFFAPKSFDVITSVSMFYDLDDPNEFVGGVKDVLSREGIWVIQQNYALDMVKQNAIDNVCLPPGDPVITDHGMVPIGEVCAGDKVLTHTGKYQAVNEIIKREYQGELVELRGYGFGHTLRVTPGHPVFTERGWVRADEVKKGDVVGRAVPRPDEPPPREFSKILAAVAGFYAAEGSSGVHGSAASFAFGLNAQEQKLASRCRDLIFELGGTASIHKTRTSTVVQTYGWLAPFLHEHFGTGAENKRVPAWDMSHEAAEQLLVCYMHGDGYEYRSAYLRGTTVSSQLALDIQMLANRLGYKCSISRQNRPETCVIEGRIVNQKPTWDILVHTAPKMRQKVWTDGVAQWGRVRHVSRIPYSGQVVNLEVAEDHSYSTPAMTVHNCHEHVTYFSVTSMQPLLARHGLEVNEVEYSPVNGGCFRTLVTHKGERPVGDSVWRAIADERKLSSPDFLRVWAGQVQRELDKTRLYVERLAEQAEHTYVYGASTRGGTILQLMGMGPEILPFAVERQAVKVGKIMAATNIPIISEEQMRRDVPGALLVSPWFFRDVFLARESDYLETGGVMLFPLPQFEIVSRA